MFALSDPVDPTSSPDSVTNPPQPTTADHISSLPTPTTAAQRAYTSAASTAELDTAGPPEVQPEGNAFTEATNTDQTAASSDRPEVIPTASSSPAPAASTVQESTQTSIPASSTLVPTSIPETTTSNQDTEIEVKDVPTGPPLQELDALTTPDPMTTDSPQGDTTDDITMAVTTVEPLTVTQPDTTKATSKPQDKPDQNKPLPAKPTVSKPRSKPEIKALDATQNANIDTPRDYQAGNKCCNHQYNPPPKQIPLKIHSVGLRGEISLILENVLQKWSALVLLGA